MNRIVRSGILALALSALPLVGCETRRLWLQVTGFDDGIIEGVWLWRLSETLGTYERACRFPFAGSDAPGNLERLSYVQECDDDRASTELSVPIRRSPSRPDSVTVGLWFVNWDSAGTYKISSYGLYGETALSESAIQL